VTLWGDEPIWQFHLKTYIVMFTDEVTLVFWELWLKSNDLSQINNQQQLRSPVRASRAHF
jgi:hypothetical protein